MPKTYSSFFFPQVNSPSSILSGRSFLSFDNADSIRGDDEQSRSTTSSSSMSSFLPSKKSFKLSRPRPSLPSIKTQAQPHVAVRSSSNSSLRQIPSPKPAPRTLPPSPPPMSVPFSAPPTRTVYDQSLISPRPFTSPSKVKPQRPIRRPDEPLFEPPSPVDSVLFSLPVFPAQTKPRPAGVGHHRRVSSGTVSTSYRASKRAHALASLEGRIAAPIPVRLPIPVHAKSFIPLSDFSSDEEDDEGETDEEGEVDDELDGARSIMPLADEKAKKGRPLPRERREKRKTIDSWFVGPPQSPSPPPSIFAGSDADSDESFESKPHSERQPGLTRRSSDFVDFSDMVDPKTWEGEDGYDAWEVIGEKKPSWLKQVVE